MDQDIKSIALRIAGVGVQLFILTVSTVAWKLKAISHVLRSSAIWSVATKAMLIVRDRTQVLGRAMMQDIQQSINISQ